MNGPVLVTGAAGFVGQHLLNALAARGGDIVAWRRSGHAGDDHRPNVRWMSVDLLDRHAVRSAIANARPAAVYHLAGFANVAQSWQNALGAFEGNVLATLHLFDALRAASLAPRVLVTSSAAVYRPQTRALAETDPLEPVSPYATSKLAQELAAKAAFDEDGIPTIVARAFNHTGPGQSLGYVVPDIARQIALIEAGRKEPELAMGNLDAERDLSDVRDVVRSYVALMERGTPGETYNVAAGRAMKVRWLVETLAADARVPVAIHIDPAKLRPNDIPLVLGSHEKLTRDTGWNPEIPLDRTIADTLDYWRERVAAEEPA